MLGNDGGGRLITGTTEVTGKWQLLIVNEDAVIEVLKVEGVDVTAARGLTSNTLTSGMLLGGGGNVDENQYKEITGVKLTSGSVIVY